MKTYPEMNAKIVGLLKMKDDPVSIYAAARIEELEKKIAALMADLQERDQALHVESEALGSADDRAERLEQALERACRDLYAAVNNCPWDDGKPCQDGDCGKPAECWKIYFLEGTDK